MVTGRCPRRWPQQSMLRSSRPRPRCGCGDIFDVPGGALEARDMQQALLMTHETTNQLEASRAAAAKKLACDELARRYLGDFLELMIPEYEKPRHVALLLEHLQALEAREID